MSEKITIKIQIKDYLADYLRAQHDSDPVQFKKNDSIGLFIRDLLVKQPANQAPNEGNLEVVLPYNQVKDPRVYNFLSENSQQILEREIYFEFYAVLHRHMKQYEGKMLKENALKLFYELFRLNEDTIKFDTLKRNYRRYLNRKSRKNIKTFLHVALF